MGYDVRLIDARQVDELYGAYSCRRFYTSKADISGVCVKLYTEDHGVADMWDDNFYSMSDNVRSHARVVSVADPERGMEVLYNRTTCTAFLFNFDYYGWIKSIALAVASDLLEDAHRVHSVHGAALDIDGKGVTLIAPSKTGKTTQSWGLLRVDNARLITDDWYFVRLGNGRPLVSGSEKNCYIDADIGDVWEEYRPLVQTVRFDNKGRGIGNVRWVNGYGSVIPMTTMRHVIFLKRDPEDRNVVTELDPGEAWEYMECNDLCNPHQMIRDDRKREVRKRFFQEYLRDCDVHLVNTVLPARETQERIRRIVL
ncbi:MAG: hypothetical protein RBQ77_05120 [Candidatus Methanomethylophilaceae archaeon]|nr:hypothetical protein [Candidatus Methanomethylophilaceae archaeon]NLF33975.1 hypothetical protein [Thermoplasmatales archaeon]